MGEGMLMLHVHPVTRSYGPLGMSVPGLDSNESAYPPSLILPPIQEVVND